MNNATDLSANCLVTHVQACIERASTSTWIDKGALCIEGFSSTKIKHLLNALCSLPGTNYLEIGLLNGSTFVPALWGNNHTNAVGIDNWSEFDGSVRGVKANLAVSVGIRDNVRLINADAFSIDAKSFDQPFNVYFYDGAHDVDSQEKAFTHFNDALAHRFVAVVDDWNWPFPQKGTRLAFEKLCYSVLFESVLPARYNGDTEQWWNGLFVAAIERPISSAA